LFRVPVVEGTVANQDCANPLLRQRCKGRFEIAVGPGIHNDEMKTQRTCRRLQVCDDGLGGGIRRVRENAEYGSIGYRLVE
jgi:hypothetical protein